MKYCSSKNIVIHDGTHCYIPLRREHPRVHLRGRFHFGCRSKAIFSVSIFMELVDKLGGNQFWNRSEFLSLPGVLRHLEGDYCLTRGQNHQGGHLGLGSLGCKTTQEDLNVCGNPIGFFPSFRTLQDLLIFSLLWGSDSFEWPVSHLCVGRAGMMGFQGFEDLQDFFLGFYSLNPHSFSDLDQLAGGAHIDAVINAPGQIRSLGSTSTGTHRDSVALPKSSWRSSPS